MFSFLKRSKSLDEHLNETKKIKVRGVRFTIRRLGVLDHLNGSKVLTENYHLYRNKKAIEENAAPALSNLQKHYRDVFMSCVVDPELSRNEGESGKTFVDNIFKDMDIAHELYMEIMIFTHGKKKVNAVLKTFR